MLGVLCIILGILQLCNANPPTPALGPSSVFLGFAANYAVLAQSGVSTVPQSHVIGDIGLSPAAASFLTGFSITKRATGLSASSVQVTGSLFAADFTTPTPLNLNNAVGNMITAYNDASTRVNPTSLNLGAGGIGGLTLAPGLYKWTTVVNIATDLTLSGTPTSTWIFQIAGGLTTASSSKIILKGGALAKNIVWAVADTVVVGSGAHFEGIILGQTSVTLLSGATHNGRILSQTAAVLQQATVRQPT
ncbi:antifreeze protein [Crucibulum laeve]|uniref:Antifreeze protein n=1 Tax=Crucibulum laeve TaxID=68775 RepID=A0A5C3LHW8_9AGAR|nr:antifreeze protein [Crucibulum laeve]